MRSEPISDEGRCRVDEVTGRVEAGGKERWSKAWRARLVTVWWGLMQVRIGRRRQPEGTCEGMRRSRLEWWSLRWYVVGRARGD
jgi:hypothetical protein